MQSLLVEWASISTTDHLLVSCFQTVSASWHELRIRNPILSPNRMFQCMMYSWKELARLGGVGMVMSCCHRTPTAQRPCAFTSSCIDANHAAIRFMTLILLVGIPLCDVLQDEAHAALLGSCCWCSRFSKHPQFYSEQDRPAAGVHHSGISSWHAYFNRCRCENDLERLEMDWNRDALHVDTSSWQHK